MKIYLIMKIIIVTGIIFSLLGPAFADDISLTISPATANFGTVAPDGSSYYTQNNLTYTVSNSNLDIYVKVSGPLTSSNSTIPLQYFQYQFNNTGSFYAFGTTSTKLVGNLPRSTGQGTILPIQCKLTVPTGTNFGNYTTVITYTGVPAGNPAPAVMTASSASTSSTTSNSTNDTNSTGSNDTGNNTNITYSLIALLEHYFD